MNNIGNNYFKFLSTQDFHLFWLQKEPLRENDFCFIRTSRQPKRNYKVDDTRSGLEDDTYCVLKWFDLFRIKANPSKILNYSFRTKSFFKYNQSYKCA